jgi:hypothetical protein
METASGEAKLAKEADAAKDATEARKKQLHSLIRIESDTNRLASISRCMFLLRATLNKGKYCMKKMCKAKKNLIQIDPTEIKVQQ